jgi:hypothetical protein
VGAFMGPKMEEYRRICGRLAILTCIASWRMLTQPSRQTSGGGFRRDKKTCRNALDAVMGPAPSEP